MFLKSYYLWPLRSWHAARFITVFLFLIADVTNYHRLSGLKQHNCILLQFWSSEVQNEPCSVAMSWVQVFATPWTAAHQAYLSFTVPQSLFKLMSIEQEMPSNHLILCHPLLLLPLILPSIRVFSSESAFRIRWPKYWSFSIRPSNEYSGLVSFRTDWFDLLAIQGTLENLLQYHNSKATNLKPFLWLNFHIHTRLLEKS